MKFFIIFNTAAFGILHATLALPTTGEALQCGVYGDGSDFYTSSTVKNVQDCIATCEKDEKCRSSEFKPSNGRCWLYAKPTAQAKTKDGKDWIFNDKGCGSQPKPQCGVYGDGSDFYTSSTVKTVQDCIATCEKDEKCRSSEFKPSNGRCWLYAKPTAQAKTKEGKDWIFNDKGCGNPDSSSPPVCGLRGKYSPKANTKIGDTRKGLTLAQCLSACQSLNTCVSIQYGGSTPDNKICNLFSVNATTARAEEDSKSIYSFYDRSCSVNTP